MLFSHQYHSMSPPIFTGSGTAEKRVCTMLEKFQRHIEKLLQRWKVAYYY